MAATHACAFCQGCRDRGHGLENIWNHTFQANFMTYYVKWESELGQDGTLCLQGVTCGLHILVVIKVVLCGVKHLKVLTFQKVLL